MQKIMFNDRYGLTQSVLEGRKTMTRRIIHDDVVKIYSDPWDLIGNCARYHFDEVVAIAQAYKDVPPYKGHPGYSNHRDLSAGWENKMFVKSYLMKYHIKITDIKVERLQDCSEEDCLKEGIEKAYLGFYVNGLRTRNWEKESHVEKNGKTYKLFPTPQDAFAALIDKVSGKGTWESNPWCFCYEFELID